MIKHTLLAVSFAMLSAPASAQIIVDGGAGDADASTGITGTWGGYLLCSDETFGAVLQVTITLDGREGVGQTRYFEGSSRWSYDYEIIEIKEGETYLFVNNSRRNKGMDDFTLSGDTLTGIRRDADCTSTLHRLSDQ